MKRLLPLLLLALLACGESDPAPSTDPPPADPDSTVEIPALRIVTTRCRPGRRPRLVNAAAQGAEVSIYRLDGAGLPLDPGEATDPVYRGPADRVPGLVSGIYRVTASYGDQIVIRRLQVTDLAVILKRAAREALVWVVDAESGAPVPSARVVRRHGGRNRESVTDRSGVCRFEVPSEGPLEILVTRNGRVGYLEDEGFPTKRYLTWLSIGHPACRPGDELRVAGVYRMREGRRIVEAPRVRLLIRDERGSIVAAAEPEGREPGFFHGRITIPAEPPPGPLWLVADLGDGEEALRIPMVDVDVGFEARLTPLAHHGPDRPNDHDFGVLAEDTLQNAVSDAEVRYRVERKDRGRWHPVLVGKGRDRDLGFVGFRAETDGLYRVRVRVVDRNGLAAEDELSKWLGNGPTPDRTTYELLPESPTVGPGETIRVGVKLPPSDLGRSVLVTMEADELGPHTVEKLFAGEGSVSFRAPERAGARVWLKARIVDRGRLRTATAEVEVRAGERRLEIELEEAEGEIVVRVPKHLPEETRAVLAVYESLNQPESLRRIEEVFAATGGAPDPAPPLAALRPVLWVPDLLFEKGEARVPFPPTDRVRTHLAVVSVATPDNRFATGLRIVGLGAGEPVLPGPAALVRGDRLANETLAAREIAVLPPTRRRIEFFRTTLPAGGAALPAHLPIDAVDARLEIHVTRGTFAPAVRWAGKASARSLETTEGAIQSFRMAALVRQADPDRAERAGILEADVRAAARAATARIWARQARDGGLAPWDGALADRKTTEKVVRALDLARKRGYEVHTERLERAKRRLEIDGEVPAERPPPRYDAGPDEGEPVPMRIRIASGLVAAVRVPHDELITTGRTFVVPDGSVPRGRFEIEFERGDGEDVDVVAVLTWRAPEDGPEPGDAVAVRSSVSRITTDGRTPLDGPADRGDTLLTTVEVEAKEGVGPFAVDVPLAAGTIALPARIFDIGTPPGVGRTDRADRVRFLCPALEKGGKTKVELVVRTVFEGTFVLRSVTVTGLDTPTHLGAAKAGKLEIH